MTLLKIPARRQTTTTPFWHRPDALVSVLSLDRDYERLCAVFPEAWRNLVRAKGLLDATTALDTPSVVSEDEHAARSRSLLDQAGMELRSSAAATRHRYPQFAAQAEQAAEALAGPRGCWPDLVLDPPDEQPWLYCGPLRTWAVHETLMPLTLLLVQPDTRRQRMMEMVDGQLASIRQQAETFLGGPVRAEGERPTMHIGDLLLAGGESSRGHKNFAHFFPLEAPGASVRGSEFTVVFANVHTERLARCSIPLLEQLTGERASVEVEEVLAASLAWFRCHDLGHFWRTGADGSSSRLDAAGLSSYERFALEETHADAVGLACAASLVDPAALAVAFGGELVRYLSRNYVNFADSAGAVLEAGWLQRSGVELRPVGASWVNRSVEALAPLARKLQQALWGPGDLGIEEIREALALGRASREQMSSLFHAVPTDLEYSFG